MKINFDSFFQEEIRSKNDKILNHNFSFDSQDHKHQISTYSILTQDTSPKPKRSILTADELQNSLESKMYEMMKSKANNTEIQFAKKKKTVNVKQMTERIYKPSPCNKKYCKKNQLQKNQKQLLAYLETKKQFRANQSFHKPHEGQVKVYERLHNQSKLKQLRMYEKSIFKIESEDPSIRSNSSKYLKNYVPFYQRLQTIISKSQQKKKFFENNPQLDFNSKQKYFSPVLYKKQYYKGVEPRYFKDLSDSRIGCQFKMQDSLNTSYQSISSLDKSLQIVNDIQQYFFNRMECIFVNQETGQIDITEQTINLLSSVQFKIMQHFIIQLEQNPIEVDSFIDKLWSYYENLDFRDKQELRVHQSKLKKYSKQNKEQMQQKQNKKQKVQVRGGCKKGKNFEKELLFV